MLELFAATNSAKTLTGFLAEIGRNLKSSVESKVPGSGNVINLIIKDSVVQRSNLLDSCNIEGRCFSNILIEDSVVQSSSIACGIEEVEPIGGESEESKARMKQEEDHQCKRKEIGEKLQKQNGSKQAEIPEKLTATGMEFVLIPPGKFMMGSYNGEEDRCNDESPMHEVTIEKPFYLRFCHFS